MALLFGIGCAHRPSSVSFLSSPSSSRGDAPLSSAIMQAVAESSPVAEPVAPADAWWTAEQFAAEYEDCETLVGSGGSMMPLYRDRTVLVVQRMEMNELRAGMTVVFIGDSGRMVAHTLVAQTPRGWVARGLANRERDTTLVRHRNYIGTVIKAFAPDPRVRSLRVPVLPVANAGPSGELRGMRPSPEMLLALAPALGN